jgi:AcrR family transcriptional regulator
MSGLRQKQKERRRRDILDAAAQLLAAQGYEETSIEEIAERAQVGVGTVYNYFHSKAELLMALFGQGADELLEQGEAIVHNPPPDPVEAVAALLCRHFEGVAGRYDKALFREFLARTFTRDFGYGGVMATLAGRLAAQVKELLEQLQKRGQIAPEVRTDEAAGALYSLFIGHLRGFAFIPELTLDAGRQALARSVALVFSGLAAPLSGPPALATAERREHVRHPNMRDLHRRLTK